jgi:hypothetical protein
MMVWLALAAQFSLPVPVSKHVRDVRELFSADDFPDYVLTARKSRIVYTRTTVQPDGRIQGCVTELTSGEPRLDKFTCATIVKRAKLLAATWTDGTPAFGVLRLPVAWLIVDAPLTHEESLRAEVPDLDLVVNRLPKGAHSLAGVYLRVAADEDGRPLACADYPPLSESGVKWYFPELVPIACQGVMSSLKLHPAIDAAGKPVRSVQSVTVRFKLDRRSTSIHVYRAATTSGLGSGFGLGGVRLAPPSFMLSAASALASRP